MRKGTGIAGATLLYGPRDGVPDLVQAMQYLLDDLRAEGRRIGGLKLTPSTLRLRAGEYELVLTLANAPLPVTSMQGLLRPSMGDTPDFTRVHLGRTLRRHHHAMGFLLRRRGAPILDLDEAMLSLAREGRFCLLPVIEATEPSLIVWQPGGLVLSSAEFRSAEVALLLEPGDSAVPLTLPPADRLRLPRPARECDAPLPALLVGTEAAVATASRADRTEAASRGRLFGNHPARPVVMPRLDRSAERLAAALREPAPAARPGARQGRLAASLWGTLLPALTGLGGVS